MGYSQLLLKMGVIDFDPQDILAILTQKSGKFGLSAQQLNTDLKWNHQICTKHASWDTLSCYGKWGVIDPDLQDHFGCFDSNF